MIRKDSAYFKKMLLEKRHEVMQMAGGLESDVDNISSQESDTGDPRHTTHLADLGSDTMVKEQKSYFNQRTRKFLQHIDEALSRIEKGTYGFCVICGKKILRERLEAVPHTRYCVPCKLRSGD
jgi:RNA polymerase-binding protein DksA